MENNREEPEESNFGPRDAAWVLLSLKNAKYPEQTFEQLPMPGYSIDRMRLPAYPPLQQLRDHIGSISMPVEKQLTASDVDDGQCRLSLNKSFVEKRYLPMLERPREDEVCGIPVMVYGPDGRTFSMEFKHSGRKIYVLNGGWKTFKRFYDLKECTFWITIWMFRHNVSNQLCFALTWKIIPQTTKWISRGTKRITAA